MCVCWGGRGAVIGKKREPQSLDERSCSMVATCPARTFIIVVAGTTTAIVAVVVVVAAVVLLLLLLSSSSASPSLFYLPGVTFIATI